ncbi:hypothetical protein AB0K00_33935 [Dactylosporangium sp. NPDC049525]|uniref:hypothetical protein n=1 Tax=Dactylosporangium sp. NPDC049525 TaxID=3154730 RepID=UPI003445B375
MGIDRSRGRVIVLIALVVVVAGAVTAWVVLRERGPHEESQVPGGPHPWRAVCTEPGTAYTSVAAYQGPGPHPTNVEVFRDAGGGDVVPDDGLSATVLPWTFGPVDYAGIQLVACVVRVAAAGESVRDCAYGGSGNGASKTAAMHRATYAVTLREIRTRRAVASARIVGDELLCPAGIGAFVNDVYSWPSAAQWDASFGRYVTGAGS